MNILSNSVAGIKSIFSKMDNMLIDLKEFVDRSATTGTAAHEVEKGIFDKVLQIGAQALHYFFTKQGDGDLGDTVTTHANVTYTRLLPRSRQYHSIFGSFSLNRVVYGTYENRKIEFVPLDSRLQLPSSEHSYLLQEWSQVIAVEVPFKKTMEMLNSIFPISLSVDTLERTNQSMATHADSYRIELAQNVTDSLENLNRSESLTIKNSLLVLSADGKGIPIRHAKDEPRVLDQQKKEAPSQIGSVWRWLAVVILLRLM